VSPETIDTSSPRKVEGRAPASPFRIRHCVEQRSLAPILRVMRRRRARARSWASHPSCSLTSTLPMRRVAANAIRANGDGRSDAQPRARDPATRGAWSRTWFTESPPDRWTLPTIGAGLDVLRLCRQTVASVEKPTAIRGCARCRRIAVALASPYVRPEREEGHDRSSHHPRRDRRSEMRPAVRPSCSCTVSGYCRAAGTVGPVCFETGRFTRR